MMSSYAEEVPGRYSLRRLLGRTGLAEAYLGEERASGMPIVFKLLTVSLSERDRLQVVETMRAYARILHPGLVRVVEVGLRGTAPFVVTEYAASGSLRQRYPPGMRLRPDILLPTVSQLGAALQHLHRQGAFHLDLKPENMLIRQDGGLMLSDAGLLSVPALAQDRLSSERESAAYLAPEQILGLPVAASDQYALACLIYEWLSGQPPFVGSAREVRAQHLHASPPPLKAPVPAEMETVLRRALEKDPGKRFPSISAFVEASLQAMRSSASQPVLSPPFSAHLSSTPQPPASPPSPAPSELVLHQQEMGAVAKAERMTRFPVCRLCQRPLPASGALLACPACGYPTDLREEERFLERLIGELSRLAQAGAASLPVGELATLSIPSLLGLRREVHFGAASWSLWQAVDRYWRRLMEVRSLLAVERERSAREAASVLQQQGQPEPAAPSAGAVPQPAAQEARPEMLDDTLIRKALTPHRQTAVEGPASPAQAESPATPPAQAPAAPQQERQQPAPAAAQSSAPAVSAASAAPLRAQQDEAPPEHQAALDLTPAAPAAPAVSVTGWPGQAPRSPLGSPPRPAPSLTAPSRPPIPARPPRPPRPSPIRTLRPLIESPAALMVALGTFLLLAALLVFHIANQQYALPVTIAAQLFFAAMVVITGRSRHFREFQGIYALFFALTVPLLFPDLGVFFKQYQPWLLALTALYGAVTYGVLAVSQRFSPFAILCAVALTVAAVSLVWAVLGDHWLWWSPAGLLGLALAETEALGGQAAASRSPLGRLLHTSWDVLRRPLAFSSLTIGSTVTSLASLLSFILLLAIWVAQPSSLDLDWLDRPAVLVTLLLACAWLLRLGARTRHRAGGYALCALLTLIPPLAGSLMVPAGARLASGFSLLLLAACFDGYARLVPPSLWRYLRPERGLTVLRFCLLLLIPFLTVLPSQVSNLQADLLPGSMIALAGAALLLLLTLLPVPEAALEEDRRVTFSVSPWMLLLPGSLLVWGYAALGQAMAWAGVGPVWWLGVLCAGLLVLSWSIRRLASRVLAAPWEVLTLAVALLIVVPLSLGLGPEWFSGKALVPLLLALLSYVMLLVQRRSLWLPLPGLLLLIGLGQLGLWITSAGGGPDGWAGLLLVCAVLLPPLAAGLRRFLPAGTAWYPRLTAQDWEAERFFTAWEWDGPLTVLALGAALWLLGLLLSSHSQDWARAVLAGAANWPWLAGLERSGWLAVSEALAMGLVAYLAGLWSKARIWLVPAALCALVALWLAQDHFWTLTAVVVGAAVVGMVVSRLRGPRWAIPWYIAGLFSLFLVMGHALPPPQEGEGSAVLAVLLGLTGVVTAVGLVEGLPEALWLVPPLLLEACVLALQYEHFSFPDVLLVPCLVPLGALVGVGLSRWRQRQAAPGRGQRWRWAVPWYAGALVGLGATSLVFFGGPWEAREAPPLQTLWLAGPYVLLGFVGLAVVVGLLEQQPAYLWLVPALVLEACALVLKNLLAGYATQPPGESVLVPALVPACALLGLALSRLGNQARQQRLRSAGPWYAAALLALGTVSATLFPGGQPLPWQGNLLLPVGYAGLVTVVGWLEGLPEALWLVPPLLLEACVVAWQHNSFPDVLLVPCLVPLGALVGVSLSRWRQRQAAPGRGQRWRWAAPWYAGALVGVATTSLALWTGRWASSLPALAQAGPFLLLGFAAIATAVGLLEQQPALLWLIPVLVTEVCSLLLGGFFKDPFWERTGLLLGLAPACVLLGLTLSRLTDQSRQQRLLHAGPCYTAALIALGAASFALFIPPLQSLGWLRPYLMLGDAALSVPVALAEGLPEVLWLIPLLTGLALAAIAGFEKEQAPLLPALVVLTTLIPLAGGKVRQGHLARLATGEGSRWHLRLVAPWYATAALAACATPFVWAIAWPEGTTRTVTLLLLLLLYALLAFWVALQEGWSLASLATVLFSLWGLATVALDQGARPLLLPLGIGALTVALLADLLWRPAVSNWPGGLGSIIRPSWSLAWVPLVALTWASLGLLHPAPLSQLPAPAAWGAALAALLIYSSGSLLRQMGVCWLSLPLALWTIGQLGWPGWPGDQQPPDLGGLTLFCLLCTVGLVGGAALLRRWPVRPYLLPLLAANCAGVLAVGIAGANSQDLERTLLATALLLGYGLFIWLLALYLNRPFLTLLTGLWTVWGAALLEKVPNRGAALISIGTAAALLGLLGLHRSRPASASTERRRAAVGQPTKREEEAR